MPSWCASSIDGTDGVAGFDGTFGFCGVFGRPFSIWIRGSFGAACAVLSSLLSLKSAAMLPAVMAAVTATVVAVFF